MRKPKPSLTRIDLKGIMENLGYSIRHNQITNDCEIKGLADYEENAYELLPILLYDIIKDQYKYASKSNIVDYLYVITQDNRYNPVLDLIKAKKWDGEKRFPDIYKALCIDEKDELSKTLIRKWFMQGAALLENKSIKPFGADGVLVLIGPQGVGKTSFFGYAALPEHLTPSDYFLENGKLNDWDKDEERRVVTSWISELGEIEGTFKKSDSSNLKGFITKSFDRYRLPYDRKDKKVPRRTNICGTANDRTNDAWYLVDDTGSRRFWTVPIIDINLDAVKKIDFLEVWREAYYLLKNDLQNFRLTKEELKELIKRNAKHTKPTKGVAEVEDILTDAIDNYVEENWEFQSVTTWKQKYDALKNIDTVTIGRAIATVLQNNPGYDEKATIRDENNTPKKTRKLPNPQPKENHHVQPRSNTNS